MKIIVAHGPQGILLLTDRGGFRLPLVEDGRGEGDEAKVRELLAFHGLRTLGELPETLGDPGLQALFLEVEPTGGHEENAWLMTNGDPAMAIRVFAKSCPERGERTYLRIAELVRTRLTPALAA